MMYLYAVLNLLIVIVIKIIYDKKQIFKGKGVAHSKEWLIVALCSSPAVYIFGHLSPLDWYYSFPLSALMCMGVIWFFFDGGLNLSRGKGWWYTGVKFAGSANSDGFLQRFSLTQQKIIKFAALLIPIGVYILTLLNER